jgi:hypothetical protein
MGWQKAQAYCSSLALAGGGWRLPTLKELLALPGAKDVKTSESFWTSDPDDNDPHYMNAVGGTFYAAYGQASSFNVRCTR